MAQVHVALGLTDSVSALTGIALHAELRRLGLRAALDEVYRQRPDDRPSAAEVAHFLATTRKTACRATAGAAVGIAEDGGGHGPGHRPGDLARRDRRAPRDQWIGGLMPRRRPTRQGEPSHLVLDNEALAQISSGRLSRPLLVALEGAIATAGRVLLPTCVLLERGYDPSTTSAAAANRVLRAVLDDELTRHRAVDAVRLRNRAGPAASVVDAHTAAAAHGVVRRYGGTATVATSDVDDLTRLLAASDPDLRASTNVQPL